MELGPRILDGASFDGYFPHEGSSRKKCVHGGSVVGNLMIKKASLNARS